MLNERREEIGQGQAEYALLVALVGLALTLLLLHFSSQLGALYQWVVNHLPT